MSNSYEVDLLARETAYRGYFTLERVRVRHSRFETGGKIEIEREVVAAREVAIVLPYDPARDEIVMIEQFRAGPFARGDHAWTMEVVAGVIEDGADAIDVARQEVFEETSLTARRLEPVMGFYTSPGGSREFAHLFVAEVDTAGAGGVHGLAHEGEDIRGHILSLAQVRDGLAQKRFNIGPAILALQWLIAHRDDLRTRWLND